MTVIYVKSSNKMLYCIITVITQTNTSLKSIVYCTFTFSLHHGCGVCGALNHRMQVFDMYVCTKKKTPSYFALQQSNKNMKKSRNI